MDQIRGGFLEPLNGMRERESFMNGFVHGVGQFRERLCAGAEAGAEAVRRGALAGSASAGPIEALLRRQRMAPERGAFPAVPWCPRLTPIPGKSILATRTAARRAMRPHRGPPDRTTNPAHDVLRHDKDSVVTVDKLLQDAARRKSQC